MGQIWMQIPMVSGSLLVAIQQVGASHKTGMQLALYIYVAGVLTFALDEII